MTRLAIIADDVSGALDAASPFAVRGLHTVVATAADRLTEALTKGPAIVGVSSNSREMKPEAARRAVADCVDELPQGIPLFKKIDSRLKGNIAAELDALAYRRALVLPAIPGFGRWSRDGFLGGFGVDTPIDIRERLGSHARRASIPDATTQDEIDAALAGAPADLLVGARSLAEALARQFAPVGTTPPRPPHRGPVLAVIGSTDPITLGQVRHVRSVCPDLTYIPAPDGIVHVPIALPLPGGALIQATETSERVYPAVVARRLGGVVEALDLSTVTHLVLSGGATAQAVLSQLGIGALDVAGEIFPGLPVARAGTLTIVTKSGGFGEDDIFTRLLGCLLEAPEGDNACPTD